jgi:hypothetical protein
MLFLRLVGVNMADGAPDDAGQAVRNYLGGLGFIVTLIGAELIKEGHPWIGAALVVAGLPIFLSGVLWKWVRTKVGTNIAAVLSKIALDPRWWIASLFVFLALSYSHFGVSSSDAAGIGGWIWAAGVSLAVLYVLVAWQRIFHATERPPPAAASPQSVPNASIEENRREDQIRTLGKSVHLLLVLKIAEFEREIFRRLIEDAPQYSERDISEDDDLLRKRTMKMDDHLRKIVANLDGSQWSFDCTMEIREAEQNRANALTNNPPRLSPMANAYLHRDYEIATEKVNRATDFLRRALEKSRLDDLQYLSRFREEQKLLDPRIFGRN